MGYRVRIPLECFHEGIHLLNSLRAIFAELFLIPRAEKDESREARQKNQNSCVCNEGLTTEFHSVSLVRSEPSTGISCDAVLASRRLAVCVVILSRVI